jgi:hypothetical protein
VVGGTLRLDSLPVIDGALLWHSPDGVRTGLAEWHFNTHATVLTSQVRFADVIGVHPINEVVILDNGAPTYLKWDGVSGIAIPGYHLVTFTTVLAAGFHEIILRDGPCNTLHYPDVVSVLARFEWCVANAELIFEQQKQADDQYIIVADSVSQGIGATHPTTEGYVSGLRAMGKSVSIVGGGGEAISLWYGADPTMLTVARRIKSHCVGTKRNHAYIQLGLNDAAYGGETTAQFGTRLGLLLDALRTMVPDLEVIVASCTLMQVDTLAAWRAATAAACATRPWIRYVDGAVRTPITAWADGLHPNSAQYAILTDFVKSILRVVSFVDFGKGRIIGARAGDPFERLVDNALAETFDLASKEQRLTQATQAERFLEKSDQLTNTIDGPGGAAYWKGTIAANTSASHAFGFAAPSSIMLVCLRFDGADGIRQDAISGTATNSHSVTRDAAGGIYAYFSAGPMTLTAATPPSWIILELTTNELLARYWGRVNGGAEVQVVGIGPNQFTGLGLGKQVGNNTFPANVSIAEIAVITDGAEGVGPDYGRLVTYRDQFKRYCLALYGITVAA